MEAAERVWEVCVQSGQPDSEVINDPLGDRSDVDDWLTRSMNNPAGMLMEFWLRSLLAEKPSADGPKEIPEPYRHVFADIVSGKSYSAELARVLLASHLHVLFSLDERWTVENVIPLLRWSTSPRRAIQAWHGFLWWGRWTESLLPHLLPQFEEAFPALHSSFGGHRDKFCRFLAGIACFSTINPRRHGWLGKFLNTAAVEERVLWAWSIQAMLKEMKEPAVPIAWDSWIRDYWQDRLDGIPVALDPKETGPMVHWLLQLRAVFAEAVDKFCEGPAPEMNNTSRHLYYELSESDLPAKSPAATTKLLAFLLENSVASYWEFEELDKIMRKIPVSSANKSELIAICNSLAKLGHPGASALRESIEETGQN